MKTALNNCFTRSLLMCVLALGCGCRSGLTTSLVWRIKDYHPAAQPRLELATIPGTNDVLVRYDESFAHSSEARPRAYWLLAYAARDTNACEHPKPHFVEAKPYANLLPVPTLDPIAPMTTNGFCYLPAADQKSFTLWQNGIELGEYQLPVYSNAPPVTVGRVLLTPVTVATDTAIVAAACMAMSGGAGGR